MKVILETGVVMESDNPEVTAQWRKYGLQELPSEKTEGEPARKTARRKKAGTSGK